MEHFQGTVCDFTLQGGWLSSSLLFKEWAVMCIWLRRCSNFLKTKHTEIYGTVGSLSPRCWKIAPVPWKLSPAVKPAQHPVSDFWGADPGWQGEIANSHFQTFSKFPELLSVRWQTWAFLFESHWSRLDACSYQQLKTKELHELSIFFWTFWQI